MRTQEVALAGLPSELLARWAGAPHRFLLDGGDSRSWGDGTALFSARPVATLSIFGDGRARISTESGSEATAGEPFALLDEFRRRFTSDHGDDFGGLVAVALSFDLSRLLEKLRVRRRPGADELVLFAAAYDWVAIWSYLDRSCRLASRGDAGEVRAAIEKWPPRAVTPAHRPGSRPLTPDASRERHLDGVRRALEHIAAGDIYQVNLAQRFSSPGAPPAATAFVDLLQSHPMPFAGYFDLGQTELVSNSPECFLDVRGRRVATLPIKGTRPRGLDAAGDRALVAALREDPKERAEHVMIVDLERNDLGRVCAVGSVRVDELMRVESFGSLHHLVSRVSGELEEGRTIGDLLRATFPGGSVTGAPKLRAIEIIDDLEPCVRGFYTGAIGYVCGERAVFNLAIRTAVCRAGRMTYHAGGGIVADSDPDREYEETLLKAQPVLSLLAASAA